MREDTSKQVKLTEWENEPSYSELRADYQDSLADHQAHVAEVEEWLDILKAEPKNKVKNRSNIIPKLARKNAEWRYASLEEPLLSKEEAFEFEPRTYEDVATAKGLSILIPYQWNNKIDRVSFINTLVRVLVNEGTVILRTGWEFETTTVTQQIQTKDNLGNVYVEEQEVEKVLKNNPTVEVCKYDNVIIDPACNGDIDKARFVIYRYTSNMSNLKKTGKYKNLKDIVIDSEPDDMEIDYTYESSQNVRKDLTVYEYWGYWDIHDTGIAELIKVTWCNGVIIEMVDNPMPDNKLPFTIIQYIPEPFAIYGKPDAYLLKDNQAIMGAVIRGMIDLMGKSANSQTGISKEFMDVTNFRRFEKGLDYRFNGMIKPEQGIYQHKFPEIPKSALEIMQMTQQEAEALTGVRSFTDGKLAGGLGRTATGVRSAMDAASKREIGILRRIAKGLKDVIHKWIAMNQVWLSDEEFIRIVEDEALIVRRDEIQGEVDVKIAISTPESDDNKSQKLAFLLQTTGNNMGQELMQIILSKIADLDGMPDISKAIAEYQPQPDPMQQMMAQLQLAEMQAKIQELQSRAQENMADIQLKTAKAAEAGAKAQLTQSDKDLKDLDFKDRLDGTDIKKEMMSKSLDIQGKLAQEKLKAQHKPQTKGQK